MKAIIKKIKEFWQYPYREEGKHICVFEEQPIKQRTKYRKCKYKGCKFISLEDDNGDWLK